MLEPLRSGQKRPAIRAWKRVCMLRSEGGQECEGLRRAPRSPAAHSAMPVGSIQSTAAATQIRRSGSRDGGAPGQPARKIVPMGKPTPPANEGVTTKGRARVETQDRAVRRRRRAEPQRADRRGGRRRRPERSDAASRADGSTGDGTSARPLLKSRRVAADRPRSPARPGLRHSGGSLAARNVAQDRQEIASGLLAGAGAEGIGDGGSGSPAGAWRRGPEPSDNRRRPA